MEDKKGFQEIYSEDLEPVTGGIENKSDGSGSRIYIVKKKRKPALHCQGPWLLDN